jgi:hypothetical protein
MAFRPIPDATCKLNRKKQIIKVKDIIFNETAISGFCPASFPCFTQGACLLSFIENQRPGVAASQY